MILAIELLSACQGIDFRNGLKPSEKLSIFYNIIRKHIPHLDKDRLLKKDFNIMMELINNNVLFQVADVEARRNCLSTLVKVVQNIVVS